MKESFADRAVCIDEFERMIVSELESKMDSSVGLKEPAVYRGLPASPKHRPFQKTNESSSRSVSAVKGGRKHDNGHSELKEVIKMGKTPIFESTDYSSFKKLEKEVRKVGFSEQGVFRQGSCTEEACRHEVTVWPKQR